MSDCVYPCPCGYYGDSLKPCTCAQGLVTKYQKRISGIMLDRIVCNADLLVGEMRPYCKLQDEGQSLMRAAMSQMNLSMGTHHSTLKLAHH